MLSLALFSSCRYPSTSVLFVLGSDAPSTRELKVEAKLWRTDEAEPALSTAFSRSGLPASGEALFTVVPRGEPRAQSVTLKITATLTATPTEPTQVLRRTLRFAFRPNVTLYQRVFFAMACLNRSNDCTRNPTSCTVQEACEERGQTCGDNGQCVSIDVAPEALPEGTDPRDASLSFDASEPRPMMDSGVDASVPVESGADATPDARDDDAANEGGDASEVADAIDAMDALDALDVTDAMDVRDASDATDARDASDAADVADVVDASDSGTSPPTRLGPVGRVVAGLGPTTCAAAIPSRAAFCWGAGRDGMSLLGVDRDSFEPQYAALRGRWGDLALAETHGCAIVESGTSSVVCFGESTQGQCGIVDPSVIDGREVMLPTEVLFVSVGRQFSCVSDANSDVACWGRGEVGQLGRGGMFVVPQPVPERVARAWDARTTVRSLQSDRFETCVVLSNDEVYCWGAVHGDVPRRLSLPPVRAFAIGEAHGCYTTMTNDLYCYGRNDLGQLGDGTFDPRPTPVLSSVRSVVELSVSGHSSCAVTVAGELYCWGINTYGQVGESAVGRELPTPTRIRLTERVQSVSVGYEHTCAVGVSGELYCWGKNDLGQLGAGFASMFESSPQRVVGN